jgi:hypothetical protein
MAVNSRKAQKAADYRKIRIRHCLRTYRAYYGRTQGAMTSTGDLQKSRLMAGFLYLGAG